ncbi:uncharacterized protein HD556DRAFT_1320554 [Suillus plorans]|uniref:Secreted protein n=1 Tax=Suillus plorans TaxID=116603 RepID=A0A9P7E3W1_9AGAM|nr:uncharacterized protein HD556DRAFT_1320554 [Suillus plorans]KAG1810449.1 hypothetical protein HD556DRAFT_1320554 [Suillus plorans]
MSPRRSTLPPLIILLIIHTCPMNSVYLSITQTPVQVATAGHLGTQPQSQVPHPSPLRLLICKSMVPQTKATHNTNSPHKPLHPWEGTSTR